MNSCTWTLESQYSCNCEKVKMVTLSLMCACCICTSGWPKLRACIAAIISPSFQDSMRIQALDISAQPMVCCNWDMVFGIQAFALEPMWTRLPSAREALCRHTLAEFVLFCYQQQCSEDHRDLKWSGSCCTISHLARNMSNPLTNNQISAAWVWIWTNIHAPCNAKTVATTRVRVFLQHKSRRRD